MATGWRNDEDEASYSVNTPLCEDMCEQKESLASMFQPEDEAFLWPGLKAVRLRRTALGFGFTLRHFIVYPPESAVHSTYTDEDGDHRGRARNRLEPMDTIFVKQVKEGGPAHGAGLCTGDRIVKVNGESIIGKTYSQVIAVIQNSDTFLELSVMPKDEDILQLAYSQDAYLKGHDAYSGNARHIPEPPPICYPRVDCKPLGMAEATEITASGGLQSDLGYRVEIPVPPSPPPRIPKTQTAVCVCNENVRTVVVPAEVHMGHMVPGEYSHAGPDPMLMRTRSYLHPRKPDLYSPGYHGDSYAVPPPRYHPSSSTVSPASQQNIDWRTYQTYREYIDHKGLHAYSRTIQERLDSLRAATAASQTSSNFAQKATWGNKIRRRSTSHDRSYQGPPMLPPRSASQDRMTGTERVSRAQDWPPRSISSDEIIRNARFHSTDYIEHGEMAPWPVDRRGYGRTEQGPRPNRQPVPQRPVMYPHSYGNSVRGRSGPHQLSCRTDIPPPAVSSDRILRVGKNQPKEAQSCKDQRLLSNHITVSVASQQSRTRAETMQSPELVKEASVGQRSTSCSVPTPQRQVQPGAPGQRIHPRDLKGLSVNGCSPVEGVVMREKPPTGKSTPLRHPSYIQAQEHQDSLFSSANLNESLDSIPFIDEPASPSVDQGASHISASAVISMAQSAAADSLSSDTPSPHMRRQLSHDQESLRSAILEQSGTRTERSKSYDEGLDTYMEEGRRRSSKPSLKVFRKAVDGHKSSDDSSSRRDSCSDIFTDFFKEGWLHFRQLNTDKNKRVGGGMRAWKQMYAVLRGHSVFLYKDRKEAHVHSQLDDEPQQVSIKACLIDISYSDTKRKNVFRLTTSDCEYLFQAESRDDMLSWIRAIQENSNLDDESTGVTSTDLINRKIKEYISMSAPTSKTEPSPKALRQSLSIKHTLLGVAGGKSQTTHSPRNEQERSSKDDSSPPRDKAAWKRGIPGLKKKPQEKKPTAGVTFGVRLENCPPAHNNRFVPLIVEVCCKLVEERGLEYTGIYRVPGNNAAISSMQEELDIKGMTDMDLHDDKWRDLNVISSLLKSFFRKLPDPLFTNVKYSDFIEANRTEDGVERLKALKRLIHELPEHHYETLKFLSGHLKTVSENCEKNKMEPRNLAIVFGPTLVRTSEDNMTHMVTHMPDQYKIVETLIQQYDWFFSEDGDEEPVTAVEQESTVQSQPVPNIDHLLTNIGRTAPSPGDVSDSATSDSAKSKQGSWGSGKDQYSRELLRSSIFASRKRKKPKDKPQMSSSEDDLDSSFSKKEIQDESEPNDERNEEVEREAGVCDRLEKSDDADRRSEKSIVNVPTEFKSDILPLKPLQFDKSNESPKKHRVLREREVVRLNSLSDPPSTSYDEGCVSDLGTLNSTSSQASGPRIRRGRIPGPWMENAGAEVCSITSDYSTTSSMTFLTGIESTALSPAHDADDERSELISEGRNIDSDSESNLSVFALTRDDGASEDVLSVREEGGDAPFQNSPSLLVSQRIVAGDTLARKRGSRQKTDSESSTDGGRSDKESRISKMLDVVKGKNSSNENDPIWRIKITDRLKCRLRSSADDMFGVGSQRTRSPETRSKRKTNIRRRHTMGGQRDFAELSVITGAELSAMDRLKPKCSSQDFSIADWLVRERHRASNPEVSLENSDLFSAGASGSSSGMLNGEAVAQLKSFSLASDAHPHKLSGAQVVRSRFYQYL
ncbi:rho GTPase-activating protein 21 isoform X3 [Pangasianodon hypophthalmus]|uniref:rho GTPase-activating protein 21 isoform X3 n=1 Tax=Pangasianodon hypophthalmus TaxID=310915 RepID=UPI002307D3CB|nr:rho GTPase-activating protein 21 isoform X3 [Pangasianodon hypophthalmus]